MRPAFDGHSGIPQEARLLFRGLADVDGVEVIGLLQSGNLVLAPGLPLDRGGALRRSESATESIDHLSRVVVSLLQGPMSHRFEWAQKTFLRLAGPALAAVKSGVGLQVPLTGFDARHFQDFVWREMFAKTLPVEDFAAVTSREFRVLRWPWMMANAIGVATAAMGHALYPRLDTRGLDVFIAETPYPGRVARGTRMVVRYHDAIPLLMPHTIKQRAYHRAMHYAALRRNAADGAWFACVSEATRQDLLSVMPDLEPRSATIPNMVSHHFGPETASPDRVPEIIWSRKNRGVPHDGGAPLAPADLQGGRLHYLLMVSTVEPRKNHRALIDAWELLRASGHPSLHLVCVGGLGWEHQAILDRFSPWLGRGGVHLLHNVPSDDLRLLYRHAAATVCPSFGEGFDFSAVEAMASGGVVAASDIPVHREVCGDAAAYFNAYAPVEMAAVIARLIAPDAEHQRTLLRNLGQEVAKTYRPDRVLPQWRTFLQRVLGASGKSA